jgi:hypothetical protein
VISAFFASTAYWLLFLIIVVGSMVLACVSLLFVRQQREKMLVEIHDNEAIGFIFATVSVVYAVLLAFLVISVWEAFGTAQHAVANEASAIVTTARYSASFPEPVRSEVHDQLRQYTELVLNQEWQMMQKPTEDPTGSIEARNALQNVWDLVQQKLPPNAINADALNSVTELSRYRLLRLVSGEDVIPDYVWLVLLTGGIIVVYFGLMLRVENPRLHMVLVALLTASIAICLWLMAIVNSPFSGEIQVSTAPLNYALNVIDSLPR